MKKGFKSCSVFLSSVVLFIGLCGPIQAGSKSTNPYVKRDTSGQIKRSSAATYQFKKETGYTKGRPGYVIDHVVPLKRGGADAPYNMQWQTKEEAKAKDKIE